MKEISFRNDILPLKDKLFRLAFRITLNREEAEDVVQETMLRVWNHREEWPQISSIEGYCLTTCRRIALDTISKSTRQTLQIDEERDATPAATTPQQAMEAKERIQMVQDVMDSLPEVQRSIMELRHVEGKSYQEIAQLLSLSESQVKVYLHRARQKVKETITQKDAYGL